MNSYSFTIKDKSDANDILVYRDNYVMVFNSAKVINSTSVVSNSNIGILESDVKRFTNYFNDTNTFTTYKSASEMINSASNIDALILLKSDITKYASSKGLAISYEFLSETKDYVITLKKKVNDAAVKNKKVVVKITNKDKSYTKKTNSKGQVSIPISWLGKLKFKISFAGDDIFVKSSANPNVTAVKGGTKIVAPASVGQGFKYIVTLKNSAGKLYEDWPPPTLIILSPSTL